MKQWWEDSLSSLVTKTYECSCGKVHKTSIKDIQISGNVINQLPSEIGEWGYQMPLIVTDVITDKLIGEAFKKLLKLKSIPFKSHVFERDHALVPDEKAVGELLIAVDRNVDLIIGIGSGTINDLCRFISYQLDKPYWICATAPSMDGFASTASPLIVNKLKTTYYCHEPERILGDLELLTQAPTEMVLAGVGDLLGKYTALADWYLGSILTGEYYCKDVAALMKHSVDCCVNDIEALKNREYSAITALMEALILSGIAMRYVENSRPASGSEHHMAHFWEMKNILRGVENPLHGTKVGVSTIIAASMYKKLLGLKPDYKKAINKALQTDFTTQNLKILEVFEEAGPAILKEKKQVSADEIVERIHLLEEKWDEIQEIVSKGMDDFIKCEDILLKLGAPTHPIQIGILEDEVTMALHHAKEIRARYTVLQMYDDLDLL